MSGETPSLAFHLAEASQRILDACTRCGKCVEICPVVPLGPAAAASSAAEVVGGVIDFLAGRGRLSEAADAWATMCNGCGECIPLCPEGINPRKMLLLANTKDATITTRTPEIFRKMARGIRLMAAMQLVPQELARLFSTPSPRQAAVVFYLGCNALRTPHLLFNAMFVLDALAIDYEVLGGPSSCCGVITTKWEGELQRGERITTNTIAKFQGFEPERVLNWCPTCQLHLGETLEGFRRTRFDMDHIASFLAAQLEDLRGRYVKPIAKRVVLHAHVGLAQVGRDVAALLSAIPGLELVETVLESGYTCGGSGCARAPQLQAKEHATLLERVRETGADILATLYHGCHAAFVDAEREGSFRVLNFTDLLVEALGGTPHDDRIKRFQMLQDWRMIVEEAQPYLRANGIEIDGGWLERHGAEIFSLAEFRGGLDCLGSGASAASAKLAGEPARPPEIT